jgi:type II secretory pathway component PulC
MVMKLPVHAASLPRIAVQALPAILLACGGAPPPASVSAAASVSPRTASPPPAATTQGAPLPLAAQSPDHVLSRAAVHEVVSQGLGAFLQRVELDDQPVRVGGKFHGFRIAKLRGNEFWNGVDLKPGDVVSGVNGFPIEHPEQAQTAFESLEVASELRVAYERDGQARELSYPIVP